MALLTNLISFFELEEPSGTRNDAYDSNNLTPSASDPTSTAGVVGDCARLDKDNPNYLTSSSTAFQTGNIDFTFVIWVRLFATIGYYVVLSKYVGSSSNDEYLLYYYHDVTKYEWAIRKADGSAVVAVDSAVVASPTSFNMIAAWHDATNDLLGISINAGTAVTTAVAGGVQTYTNNFTIGKNDGADYMNGDVDQFGFWKRKLSDAEITWLYNSGSGRSYADIVAEAGSGFQSAWAARSNVIIGG